MSHGFHRALDWSKFTELAHMSTVSLRVIIAKVSAWKSVAIPISVKILYVGGVSGQWCTGMLKLCRARRVWSQLAVMFQ